MWSVAHIDNEKNILGLLDENENAKLIDLGCGYGDWTLKLAQKIKTTDIYGVDIVDESLKSATQKGVKTCKADLNNKLPLEDSSFDVIHANQVIEHVANLDLFASEIYRILKRGGYAIVSTENGSSWCNIFASIMGWQIFSLTSITKRKLGLGNPLALFRNKRVKYYDSWTHKTIFNYRGFIEFLKIYGFRVDKVKASGYFPLPNIFSKIDKRHSYFMTVKIYK